MKQIENTIAGRLYHIRHGAKLTNHDRKFIKYINRSLLPKRSIVLSKFGHIGKVIDWVYGENVIEFANCRGLRCNKRSELILIKKARL